MSDYFVKAKYKGDGDLRYVTTRCRMSEDEFKKFCADLIRSAFSKIVELDIERMDD